MPNYAVVIHHREANWEELSAERRAQILKRYFEWTDQLAADGVHRGAHALRDGGRTLRREGDQVIDGPFTETKEVVGGFVLIEAVDFDEAVERARGCPALELGDSVQVREVSSHQRPAQR